MKPISVMPGRMRDGSRSRRRHRQATARLLLALFISGCLLATSGLAEARAQTRQSTGDAASPTDRMETTTRPTTTKGAATAERKNNRPCRGLEDAIAAAATPLEKARACLAMARCTLVLRCAQPLSVRCSGSTEAGDALARTAGDGLAFLDRASAMLSQVDEGADVTMSMEDRIDLLRAFGEMFVALGQDPASESFKEGLIGACNGLAVYLDDDNPSVVESAELWLGVAYRLAERPDRTLQVIRLIMTTPADPRIGLTARLQRCLALGDQGNHVAGIALCLRLGSRVETWFADEDPATRRRAVDTVRFTRVELLRDWAVKLRAAGQDDRAKDAETEAKKLVGQQPYPPPTDHWLGLLEAIAGLPEWKVTPESPTTRPAGGRSSLAETSRGLQPCGSSASPSVIGKGITTR